MRFIPHQVLLSLLFSITIFLLPACLKEKKLQQSSDLKTGKFSIEKGSFNFFVIGDWGRRGKYKQKDVAASMNESFLAFDPTFIVSTGDNFYNNGVSSTEDPLWDQSFEKIYTGNLLSKDWFIVLGNHDYKGNPQAEIDYTQKSKRWKLPSRYYTFSIPINDSVSARFIFLDTNPFIKGYYKTPDKYADLTKQDTTQQLKWLDSVLVHSTEKWKFVFGHHPIYSSNPRHGNSPELIRLLKPRLEKHHVQVYFSGHDHDLQHQKPEGSIDYIVSGAGSQTRRTAKKSFTKYANNAAGFAAVSITNDSLVLYFINDQGNKLYSFSRGVTE